MTQTTLISRIEDERARWFWIDEVLKGNVLSTSEELEALFPHDRNYSRPFVRTMRDIHPEQIIEQDFDVYFRDYLRDIRQGIAYGCPRCDKIIIGAPKIMPASDGQSMQFTCVNCLEPILRL